MLPQLTPKARGRKRSFFPERCYLAWRPTGAQRSFGSMGSFIQGGARPALGCHHAAPLGRPNARLFVALRWTKPCRAYPAGCHGGTRQIRSTKSEIRNESKGTKRRKSKTSTQTGPSRSVTTLHRLRLGPRARFRGPTSTLALPSSTGLVFEARSRRGAPAGGRSVSAARRNRFSGSEFPAPRSQTHAQTAPALAR